MPLSVKLATFAKYLDQPALVKKMNNVAPFVLATGGAGYCVYDNFKTDKSNRKKKFVQNASVMTFTIASALLATRGLKIKGNEIFEGLIELPQFPKREFAKIWTKVSDEKILKILINFKKEKILKFSEV